VNEGWAKAYGLGIIVSLGIRALTGLTTSVRRFYYVLGISSMFIDARVDIGGSTVVDCVTEIAGRAGIAC
jgi:hypothetical protein